jgi:hypothetical protein
MTDSLPDYSDHQEKPTGDNLLLLKKSALEMLELDQEIDTKTAELKELTKRRKAFSEDILPRLMVDMGLDKISIVGGVSVVVKKAVRCGEPPQDPDKKKQWTSYLQDTGNDGLVKREFKISYGRDATEWAKTFRQMVQDAAVQEHAAVTEKETVNAQTLMAFLRKEIEAHPDKLEELLSMFGAIRQVYAEIE